MLRSVVWIAVSTTALLRASSAVAQSPDTALDACNVVWTSPGKDARDSLPIGNGVVGANVWVEENGDLIFYVSRNDSLSEVQRLMKVGRVRVRLDPDPFEAGKPFHETLTLRQGRLDIDAGAAEHAVHLSLLVDADSPTIYVTGKSAQSEHVQVTLEDWRESARKLNPTELESSWILRGAPAEWAGDATEAADQFPADPEGVVWYHRNSHSVVARHVSEQGLSQYADLVGDPLKNNTFGGSITADGFSRATPRTLQSCGGVTSFEVRIATEAAQTPTAEAWLNRVRETSRTAVAFEVAAGRTAKWWQQYWHRSYVFVDGDMPLGGLLQNRHGLRIGADAAGQNLFSGQIGRANLLGRALSPPEIALLRQSRSALENRFASDRVVSKTSAAVTSVGAVSPAADDPEASTLSGGYLEAPRSTLPSMPASFTAEAWIRPGQVSGRIFDKITPGGTDGFLLDLYNGHLRFICGDRTFIASTPIPSDVWTHVACSFDADRDVATLYQNGKVVAGDPPGPIVAKFPSQVTLAYVYTKYQYACQMRSTFPAHFQGGIFTVDPKYAYYGPDIRKIDVTPDYRFYGANYWWQNTRFLYLPQLAQGNFDLIQPFFNFYLDKAALFEARAKKYYGARGVYMQECISTFGLPGMGDFGYGEKVYSEQYTQNIWQQCLELSVILLDYYEYTGDAAFLHDKALPWARSALEFYDTRFGRDASGKLHIAPTHAVETYWTDVVNDTPSVAGLHYVIDRLLALPGGTTRPADRAHWQKLRNELPALPKRVIDGKTVPDNAESYNPQRTNYEAPDLYSVFPFRLYGIGETAYPIEEAREAFRRMPNPDHTCWYQTGIFAALLGLTDEAQKDVQLRSSAHLPGFRFAGFFGSPHDWCPDEDGPGNMSNTLQEMLMQCKGDQIRLLPTWPRDWNVRFKLHAPHNTVVECAYRSGKIETLTVTPSARRKDIIMPLFGDEKSQTNSSDAVERIRP